MATPFVSPPPSPTYSNLSPSQSPRHQSRPGSPRCASSPIIPTLSQFTMSANPVPYHDDWTVTTFADAASIMAPAAIEAVTTAADSQFIAWMLASTTRSSGLTTYPAANESSFNSLDIFGLTSGSAFEDHSNQNNYQIAPPVDVSLMNYATVSSPGSITTLAESFSGREISYSPTEYVFQPVESVAPSTNINPVSPSTQLAIRKRKAATDNTTWRVQKSKAKYVESKNDDMFQVFKISGGASSKSKDPKVRQRTAVNRKLGACLYHRSCKKPCDPSWLPYMRCATSKQPTFHLQLEQIRLFRQRPPFGHPLNSQREELFLLQELDGASPFGSIEISLTQDIGSELKILVTPFEPRQGDKTNHVWFRNGEKMVIEMPCYCIASVSAARQSLCQYIGDSQRQYLEDIVRKSNGVSKDVLLQALQLSNSSSLIRTALQILAINRMIERDWRFSSEETLGIPSVVNFDCPWFGTVPIPPSVDTQLDQCIIQGFLTPLAKSLLDELQEKMYNRKKEDLFEVFITVFILATNLEWLLRHSRNNAIRYNSKQRYNYIPLAKTYIDSFNIFCSHFRFFSRGSAFTPKGSSKVKSDGLTRDQMLFIEKVKARLAAQEEYLSQLRQDKKYETELYWSHQILLAGWTPHSTDIEEEIINGRRRLAI